MKKFLNIFLLYFVLTIIIVLSLFILIYNLLNWVIYNFNLFIIFIFIILFFIIIYIQFKKWQKYMIYALWIYFLSIFVLYFFTFNNSIFELKDLNDIEFITKYQNIKVSDSENTYEYLKNLKDENFNENSTFWIYKQKIDEIHKNKQYSNQLIIAENIYNCYLWVKSIDLCNWLSFDEYVKDKDLSLISQEFEFKLNIFELINKNNIYKTKWELSLQWDSSRLRANHYYLLNLLNNKEYTKVENYFINSYKLYLNALNWDVDSVEMITYLTVISILNSQLDYILSSYDLPKWAFSNLKSELWNFSLNPNEIYWNTIKWEYQYFLTIIPKNKLNNFIYDYENTISILKNIIYFYHINKNQEFINNMDYLIENRLDNFLKYNIVWNIYSLRFSIMHSWFNLFYNDLENIKEQIINFKNKI